MYEWVGRDGGKGREFGGGSWDIDMLNLHIMDYNQENNFTSEGKFCVLS